MGLQSRELIIVLCVCSFPGATELLRKVGRGRSNDRSHFLTARAGHTHSGSGTTRPPLETTVKVKQEDISPNFDADYSSPDIASPPNLQEQSSFRPQGKRLHKQISDEEFFGIQEQHNILLGDGNKELHGIRQELRELRSDLQELAAGIRQPLDRLADYIQALLPLLQHPPRSRMMEMTDSFTQPDEEETVGSGSSLSQSRRTGCKTCKRPKLGM
ncbi:hypothetical protein chiPu_0004473 [Chiloscyllium punctatum]|uniref:Uncharacterized protein n=1 Tax=Chiloscyllium punctatum TaxID=137246 RepID=A0A401S6N7_CHIPU|nr:hypothetical protein [Chiloscyllium punctatum]